VAGSTLWLLGGIVEVGETEVRALVLIALPSQCTDWDRMSLFDDRLFI
jgi:hypothetical protein